MTKNQNIILISRHITKDKRKEYKKEKLARLSVGSNQSLLSLLSYSFKIVKLSLRDYSRKTTNRIRLYHRFGSYLLVMNKRHGSEFVVKYLKACNLALSKALAGEPFVSLRDIEPDLPLPRLSSSGLPVIIGTRDRRSILTNNRSVLRMYMSLFSLYRVINIPSKLKIGTITDDYAGNKDFLLQFGGWLAINSNSIIGSVTGNLKVSLSARHFLFRETASPTCKKSWQGILLEAIKVYNDPRLWPLFQQYAKATGSTLVSTIEDLAKHIPVDLAYEHLPSKEGPMGFGCHLGQLSLKEEPAGKMRVFAIVDAWTQSLFQPLHDFLFLILDKFPNDGKKDQGLSFKRACQKATKFNCCFGYDLSAATDRLPILLQEAILTSLIGSDAASAWRGLLVNREYRLLNNKLTNSYLKGEPYEDIFYKVGQPMGALSSWAMLSLTHHMIMQYCSWLLSPIGPLNKWEDRYEILGDDIVIFDHALASKYIEVMALIGVPINTAKSVVAKNKAVVEYAKRTWSGQEVSPISWKIFLSQDTWRGRLSAIIGLFLKEESFRVKPYAVINTVLAKTNWDQRPKNDQMSLLALINSYMKNNLNYSIGLVNKFRPVHTRGELTFLNFSWDQGREILSCLLKDKTLPRIIVKDAMYYLLEWALKEVLRKRLIALSEKYTDEWLDKQVRRTVEAMLGTLPHDYKVKVHFTLRQTLFNQKVIYPSMFNMDLILDHRTKLEVLYEMIERKMNDLSAFQYLDRLHDPSSKLPVVEIKTTELLQLVLKGYKEQWDLLKDGNFSKERFIKFVKSQTNIRRLKHRDLFLDPESHEEDANNN